MIYSIQNAYGDVHGVFPLPESKLSRDEWAERLKDEIPENMIGINGITASAFKRSIRSDETVDRVVVDINPDVQDEAITRVHDTVASIAQESERAA